MKGKKKKREEKKFTFNDHKENLNVFTPTKINFRFSLIVFMTLRNENFLM